MFFVFKKQKHNHELITTVVGSLGALRHSGILTMPSSSSHKSPISAELTSSSSSLDTVFSECCTHGNGAVARGKRVWAARGTERVCRARSWLRLHPVRCELTRCDVLQRIFASTSARMSRAGMHLAPVRAEFLSFPLMRGICDDVEIAMRAVPASRADRDALQGVAPPPHRHTGCFPTARPTSGAIAIRAKCDTIPSKSCKVQARKSDSPCAPAYGRVLCCTHPALQWVCLCQHLACVTCAPVLRALSCPLCGVCSGTSADPLTHPRRPVGTANNSPGASRAPTAGQRGSTGGSGSSERGGRARGGENVLSALQAKEGNVLTGLRV
jgi:hypothetical protein